jgi:hypothetical protein
MDSAISEPAPSHRPVTRRNLVQPRYAPAILLAGLVLVAPRTIAAQTLDEHLKPLAPLLRTWSGDLMAPDSSRAWKTYREYRPIWDGSVVRFTDSTPATGGFSEGYFYWDRGEGKIAVFIIGQRGIYSRGFVSLEGNLLTIAGQISFPERTFDFRNTFEFAADGRMIDRWFQNAFGPWRAGHLIELTAGPPAERD